jgi:hypothetical protein
MEERNALVDKYAEFLRSIGSGFPLASSVEASDRFREKVWTAWEEGRNLPMGRTAAFKEWLKKQTDIRHNPVTWEDIKALGVQLDCYLTSRRDPFMRQAYANTVDPVDFANGSEWYLGDGGYSRMIMRRNGTLALTDNSIPRTRAKWDDPEARKLRKSIEEGMKELYGSEFETNPPVKPKKYDSSLLPGLQVGDKIKLLYESESYYRSSQQSSRRKISSWLHVYRREGDIAYLCRGFRAPLIPGGVGSFSQRTPTGLLKLNVVGGLLYHSGPGPQSKRRYGVVAVVDLKRTSTSPNPGKPRVVTRTPKFLYHASSADRMSNIRSKGLLPSEKTHWGGDLGAKSEGKVFAAETLEKALYYAAIVFRETLEQNGVAYVPVVLKIKTAGQRWNYGEREYWTEKKVVPARLSVAWHGSWHPVAETSYIDEDMYYEWNDDEQQYVNWDGEPVGVKATDAVEDVKLFYLK